VAETHIPELPAGLFEQLVALRRDIHMHPELSFEEARTGEAVATALEGFGLSPRRGVVKTGVVVDIGTGDGPTVALRADLDALPMQEETELPFASTIPNVMHSCAHDGHTACLVGAAALLAADPPTQGRVRLIFQPAEERGNGALHVCNEGHMDGVQAIFGIHVDNRWPAGTVVVSPGPACASSRSFTIEVKGRGGHAARPHEGIDAIVAGAAIVTALQSIVAREIRPGEPAVITVGRFEGGAHRSSLAASASMLGTIRCFDDEVSTALRDAVDRVVRSVAAAYRCEVEVTFGEGCPAVVNDPGVVDIARRAARAVVGDARVLPLPYPNTGAEDFSFYLRHAPGAYARLGGRKPGDELLPTHNPRFDFDERTLAVGARYLESAARHAIAALTTGTVGPEVD
jgi:hippurate hydrolase